MLSMTELLPVAETTSAEEISPVATLVCCGCYTFEISLVLTLIRVATTIYRGAEGTSYT